MKNRWIVLAVKLIVGNKIKKNLSETKKQTAKMHKSDVLVNLARVRFKQLV